jgi:hypothetical protein
MIDTPRGVSGQPLLSQFPPWRYAARVGRCRIMFKTMEVTHAPVAFGIGENHAEEGYMLAGGSIIVAQPLGSVRAAQGEY